MKLKIVIDEYVQYRRSLGEKFDGNATHLRTFYNWIGKNVQVAQISRKMIIEFLYGDGPVTSYWFLKHSVLKGLYAYAITREYVNTSPLPTELPKKPMPFVPYIYSNEELKKLLKTALWINTRCENDPYTIHMILLIMYATGLRPNEALTLTNADVDTIENVLIIRDAKNFKSRLVPFCSQLSGIIQNYIKWCKEKGYSQEGEFPFFSLGIDEQFIKKKRLGVIFKRIRTNAGVKRPTDDNVQPRLMDLRHTFAVHRLTEWYRKQANVQQLLPLLSVYMGQSHLSSTSVYLTCTSQLLFEAAGRFEQYINGGVL